MNIFKDTMSEMTYEQVEKLDMNMNGRSMAFPVRKIIF
mgnify:FL=1